MYRKVFKRIIDFILATLAFTLLCPIFICVTLWLAVANGGRPFFFQERPGKDEKLFKIIKFKSMTDARGPNGKLLPDKDRLTKIGSFVRKTSLDEIPQLINVIKGDMSLVGPRPLLIEYLPHYSERERLRHTVRPGVTGLAQVKGRNSVTWDEKLEFDAVYVETLSFWGDVKILFYTVLGVLKRKDVNTVPSQSGVLLSFARENECVLRPLEEQDLPSRVEWLNDSRVHKTMNIQTPISLKGTQEWFTRNQGNRCRADFTLEWNGTPVAMSGVSVGESGVEGYTFVAPEMKGRGFGLLAQFLRLVYVFELLGFEEVNAVVDSENKVSKYIVEKLGFKRTHIAEGEIIKQGKKIDRLHYICTPLDFNRDIFGYKIVGKTLKYTHKRGFGTTAPNFVK